MAETEIRPEQPEPFLLGCAWPASAEVSYPRCDPAADEALLPEDTRAVAAIPVGVRFAFEGEPDTLEVEYRTETSDLGYRGEGAGTEFTLFRGDRRIDSVRAQPGTGRLRLRVGPGDGLATLYLPEGMRPTVTALRAEGAEIRPAPQQARWLCYGDSIAEGWCASEPAGAWPHIVSRQSQLDVVNFGYAGSARGELQSAREIAQLEAELISVAHGTNCWTRTPHSEEAFGQGLHAFLDTVRAGHASTPIVAISPILRMDAEQKSNEFGASLADLRAVFERVVEERVSSGDRQLELVCGRNLVPSENLPDGIHPDNEGHQRIAKVLRPILDAAIRKGEAHA